MKMYNDEILDRNIHSVNLRVMKKATTQRLLTNHSCGDEIGVFLKIEDGVIVDASWMGYGCAISQASADLMVDMIKGKKVTEAAKLSWKDVPALAGVMNMPARVKCAELPWEIFEYC